MRKGGRSARRSWRALAVAGGVLTVLAFSAGVSHRWNQGGGLDIAYVVLALGTMALTFPATREWLAEATNIKLPGGVEVSRQVADAVETVKWLPDVKEDKGDEETSAPDEPLKILEADWHEEPSSALSALREAVRDRVAWIQKEVYPPPERKHTDHSALEKIEKDGLISAQEARVAKTVLQVSGRMLAAGYDSDSEERHESVIGFMEGADSVAHQLRLIALDNQVRKDLKHQGFRLLDLRGQPRGRWPDFYAFHPDRLDKPLRVSVRMARTKDSNLLRLTRERLRTKSLESPLDELAQRIIVVPCTSKSNLEDDEEEPAIPAITRGEPLKDWLATHLSAEA